MNNRIHLVEYSPLIGHHLPYLKVLTKHFLEKGCMVTIWVIDQKNQEKLLSYLDGFSSDFLDIRVLVFSYRFKFLIKTGRVVFSKYHHSLGVWGLVKANLSKTAHRNDLVFMTWLQHSCTQVPKILRSWLLPKNWMAIDGFAIEKRPTLPQENFDRYLKSTHEIQIYGEPSCRAILLLNEEMPPVLAERFPGTNFIKFPDFIEPVTVTDHPAICKEIQKKAKNRKIFLFSGRMIPKRNFIPFLKIVKDLDVEKWHPCAVGSLEKTDYTEQEWAFIQKTMATCPALFLKNLRPDDYELNSLIQMADLFWLAYKNHPHSSNMLTRAANYKTAVAATEGSLIASRSERYKLGLSINPYDAQKSAQLINEFIPFHISASGQQQYATEQSIDALDKVIENLLTGPLATSNFLKIHL